MGWRRRHGAGLESREIIGYLGAASGGLLIVFKPLGAGDVVLQKQLQAAGGLVEDGVLISVVAAVFGALY